MNKRNLQQIFNNYIEKFEYITDENSNNENYKWFIAKKFRALMDEALSKDGEEFVSALYNAKISTKNIIDSYTQPFSGLVELAKREPNTVKQMFVELYSDDNGDIHTQEKLISDFFNKSNELLDRYFPQSFLYRQNSHSVSAYLFLYDPDNHYMYKAEQSKDFADCIEFYTDWGSGDEIKLDIYYKMCDWLVEQIRLCPELLSTDKSRFTLPNSDEMFEDRNKHMLAFDIIYSCTVYNLFDGVSFSRLKMKERNLLLERENTALRLLENYNKAVEEEKTIDTAAKAIEDVLCTDTVIIHEKFGRGKVVSFDNGKITVSFNENSDTPKGLDIFSMFSKGFAKFEDPEINAVVTSMIPKLKNKNSIQNKIRQAAKELEPYKKFLEQYLL